MLSFDEIMNVTGGDSMAFIDTSGRNLECTRFFAGARCSN